MWCLVNIAHIKPFVYASWSFRRRGWVIYSTKTQNLGNLRCVTVGSRTLRIPIRNKNHWSMGKYLMAQTKRYIRMTSNYWYSTLYKIRGKLSKRTAPLISLEKYNKNIWLESLDTSIVYPTSKVTSHLMSSKNMYAIFLSR